MIPLFLFPTKLPLTVDRIEGHYAIVEWKDGSLSNIERRILPPSLHEGQALILYLRPAKEGCATAISSHPAFLDQASTTIELPYDNHLKLGHRYELIIQPLRSTYVEQPQRFELKLSTQLLLRRAAAVLSSTPSI